jgi:hypothetical protein|tara:strand:- start:114 stop:464 length:351 start_codon:yes stop_codon:yes gene_type:complete
MNKRDRQIQRNNISQLIRVSNRNRNVLKWSPNETEDHIDMKFHICKQLKKWGHEFYTEAIFADSGLRADVIDADEGIIYEVYQTEGEDSLIRKAASYPLEVRFIAAGQKFVEKLLL